MSLDVRIVSGKGEKNAATVSEFGQLIVASSHYNVTSSAVMSATATAYNLVVPSHGKRLVVSGAILSADKNVSNTQPAVVDIYTANSPDSVTIIDTVFELDLVRFGTFGELGLNLLEDEGVWINAKTDDATVKISLFYYYV